MPKLANKAPIKLTVDIRPGLVSPVQKQAWKRFWQKLITEVKASER